MKTKVGIIGAGAWGTAIGKNLAEHGASVQMWDYNSAVVSEINGQHTNHRFLFGITLPKGVTATPDIREAASGKKFLILAVPSLYLLDTLTGIVSSPDIAGGKVVIGILTKGFLSSPKGPTLITNGILSVLPKKYSGNLVYISGPSHAEEVARGKLTGLISASLNGKNAIMFRELLQSSSIMVFPSLDIIGVQVCGAVKNVIAIAYGMLDALKELSDMFGDNTESLLIAAGLNEIQILGKILGSTHQETFTSIAGVGDLDVTCKSKYGRNRRFGREIILDRILERYKNIDDLISRISEIGYLPEGVIASKNVEELRQSHNIRLPICETVYDILNNGKDPFAAVNEMLSGISTRLKIE